ncbi:MAG: hypothetical protein IJS68_00235 [Clostridia bacterium]|nr:hypothetical protein [Clostridia bacterium]
MQNSKIINVDNRKENARITASFSHKILPFLFVLSFLWLKFFDELTMFNMDATAGWGWSSFAVELFLYGGFFALVNFCLLFCYRMIITASPHTHLVPDVAIKDNIMWAMIARNLMLGALYFLCFSMPFLYGYMIVADLVITFVAFIVFAIIIIKKYCDVVFAPYLFKALLLPLIIYEFIMVGIDCMGYFI